MFMTGKEGRGPVATVKRANVPPTHPTVWIGLALSVVGLLLAVYAYTGARVYSIAYAFVALAGGLLALTGILVAAWGRAVMASRASRSRRAAFSADAMSIARPAPAESAPTSEDVPTVARSRERKAFAFPLPRRASKERKEKKEKEKDAIPAGVFAFKRREPARTPGPEPEPETEREPIRLAPSPETPAPEPDAPLVTLAPPAEPVRVTLRCPRCSTTFSAQGVRPFAASCSACGFSATV